MSDKNLQTGEKQPMVSVVMITYGHEKYIEEAIIGVLSQKCNFMIEVIISNDNSPDDTDNVIKNYLEENAVADNIVIKYTNQDANKGMHENFSWAIAQATGKYIALCEGDDFWLTSLKLQKQVDFLEANPNYALCFHNAMLHFENSDKADKAFLTGESREYSGEEILKKWTIPTASVVFRRYAFRKIDNPDFLYCDTVLFLTAADYGQIWGMKDVMCVYRKHDGGATAVQIRTVDRTKKFIKHHLAIKDRFDGKYDALENLIVSSTYLDMSIRCLIKYDPRFLVYLYNSYKYDSNYFHTEMKRKINVLFQR